MLAVQPELVQGAQHGDEPVAQAVLERDPADVDPARHQHDLLVLDVHAAERPDVLREVEQLGFAEGLGGEPTAISLVHDRRVEALFDGRPDRERRREVVPGDDEVGAIAHTDLVDPREQVIAGVAGGDIGEAGLDPHAHQRQSLTRLPLAGRRELGVAEHHAHLAVGALWMGLGHVQGHVDVVAAGGQRTLEDGRVEPWVAGVEHHIGTTGDGQLGHGLGGRRVDGGGDHPPPPVVAGGRAGGERRSPWIDVGDGDVLERLASRGDGDERRADASGADHEHPHRGTVARQREPAGGIVSVAFRVARSDDVATARQPG